MRAIRRIRIYLIGDGIVEEELRRRVSGHSSAGIRSDAAMDMDGPAYVPTWINRREIDDAARIGNLISAQKIVSDLVRIAGTGYVRIDALGVGRSEERRVGKEWRAGG